MENRLTHLEVVNRGEVTMRKIKRLFTILVLLAATSLIGCAQNSVKSDAINRLDLSKLLLSVDNMPEHSSWTTEGTYHTVIDKDRTSDLAAIAFYTNIYPDLYSSKVEAFRYNSVEDAKTDYDYATQEFGQGSPPSEWKFQSLLADQNQVSCDNYSNVAFPVCFWVARYDRIIIDFRVWLIPGHMSLSDMESLVSQIDDKAAKYIVNK
jgi:hypothetical protein